MKTDMYYNVLLGYDGMNSEGKSLCSVHEVADFILTHDVALITEADGTPLLKAENGDILYINDMRYRDELLTELRKGEGFRGRFGI